MSKCDCGHDHEHGQHQACHEHDNHHSCHEHAHHDENCDCGCNHEHAHEHIHDENCDCGCNHEHGQHNSNNLELYTEDINTPVVYSTERIINGGAETSPEAIINVYIDKMDSLAAWIEEQGGLIGHLKMLIQDNAGVGELWLSCAGANTTTNSSEAWTKAKSITNYKIGFTSIVIGIDETSLANKISELLA